jgi:hypothetical protein
MATLTAYKTTESQDLGPGPNLIITVGETEVFLLKSEDQIALQQYVDTGVKLPVSQSALKMLLKYNDDQSKTFENLIEVYSKIYQHCSHFRTQVYPESVKSASNILAYAIKVPDYYDDIIAAFQDFVDGKITKEAAKVEIKDYTGSLRTNIGFYVTKLDEVHTAIQQFDTDTLADQGELDRATASYSDTFKLNDAAILEQQTAIDNLKNEIETVKAEYTQSVIIASTTPIYAWVPFFGYIIGPTVAGLYGAKAVELDKKIAALKAELETKTADVQLRTELKGTLSLVNENLAETSKKCSAALESLARIKTVWTNLDAALENIPTGLDDIDKKESLRGLQRAVDSAKTEWEQIGKLANNYVATAYIRLEDTNLPKLI